MIYKVKRILKCLRGKKKKKRHNNPAGLPSASHQGQDSVTGCRGPGDPSQLRALRARAVNLLRSRDLEPKNVPGRWMWGPGCALSPQQGCGHPLAVPRATEGCSPSSCPAQPRPRSQGAEQEDARHSMARYGACTATSLSASPCTPQILIA